MLSNPSKANGGIGSKAWLKYNKDKCILKNMKSFV